MTKDEALKRALDFIENSEGGTADLEAAIKEALAQPEQEPVAWISAAELVIMRGNALGGAKDWRVNLGLTPEDGDVGLYTTPPQRTWVGLTDAEISCLWLSTSPYFNEDDFARAIEAKLKEKNS